MAEKHTMARPYAQAIFDLATRENTLESWSSSLEVLSQIASDEKIISVITDPKIDNPQIIQMFQDIAQEMLDEKALNFVKLIAENNRFNLIVEIAQEFEVLKLNAKGHIEVQVISAYNVNAAQKNLITEKLVKRLNKDVTLNTSIDKSLLGGIIIKAGDLVIDGSIANQLDKIGKSLVK